MTNRFCGSCMIDVGLDPSRSRLALPGCKSIRLAFCDGKLHDCVIPVDEFGAAVHGRKAASPDTDYSLETIRVPGHSLLA